MKAFSNISKSIVLIIVITVFTFLNYAYNNYDFTTGSNTYYSPNFKINQIAIFILFIASIIFLLDKPKIGKTLTTVGLSINLTYISKILMVFYSERNLGFGFNKNLPLIAYTLITILITLITFINLDLKNKNSSTSNKARLIGIISSVVLYVLSQLNWFCRINTF